ncbi:hypothetical protein ACLB1M_25435 [Escherichia coli]
MTKHGSSAAVAKGGWHGLGNTRFKSSVNRTPRQKTNGTPGDKRELLLELMLLADVGMLGMPAANRPLFVRYRRLNRSCGSSVYHSGAKSGCGTNGQRKELRCCRYSRN